MDSRIQELLELAEVEGIPLPYSPETIVAMENIGAVVNLLTGAILIGEADQPYGWTWTPLGEALAVVMAAENGGKPWICASI
jgi:hypothetical protein